MAMEVVLEALVKVREVLEFLEIKARDPLQDLPEPWRDQTTPSVDYHLGHTEGFRD